jgi:hypothetical protein
MADVFISYAREDRPTAERLAKVLAARGLTVWWDRDIQVGKSYAHVIETELKSADCVIVLWSKASVASDWVRDEAQSGRDRGVLVPALIDVKEPAIGFRSMQTADLTGWQGEADHPGALQLFAAVDALARDTGAPAPAIQPRPEAGTDTVSSQPRRKPTVWLALGGAVVVVGGLAGWWLTGRDCGTGSGTVYIQFPASVARQAAEDLRAAINDAGFNAPGTQKVDETPNRMQIRYFDPAQQPQVNTLRCVLKKQGYASVDIQPNLDGRPSPIEVWFAGKP